MDGALIVVDADGRYVDANQRALDLMGVTLPELQAAAPSSFAASPVDPGEAIAFRAAWEQAGSPDVSGETTVVRPDGHRVRVRFAITPNVDRTYSVALEPATSSTDRPTELRTIGAVLSAWRVAERRLEQLQPGTDEWAAAQDEVAWLRDRHANLFRSQQRP